MYPPISINPSTCIHPSTWIHPSTCIHPSNCMHPPVHPPIIHPDQLKVWPSWHAFWSLSFSLSNVRLFVKSMVSLCSAILIYPLCCMMSSHRSLPLSLRWDLTFSDVAYLVLPRYWDAASVKFAIERVIASIQVDSLDCGELFNVQHVLTVDGTWLQHKNKNNWQGF